MINTILSSWQYFITLHGCLNILYKSQINPDIAFLDPIGSLDFTLLTIGDNQFVNCILWLLTKWLSDWVTEWPNDQVTKWSSDQVTKWPGDPNDRKLRRRLTVWYILSLSPIQSMVSPWASPPKWQLRKRKIDSIEIPPIPQNKFENREKMPIIIL